MNELQKYRINLTISKDETNEQVASVTASNLTGLELQTLVDLSLNGIRELPPPEILTGKHGWMRKRKKHVHQKDVPKPDGFDLKDVE